jgi:hypothetical protein
MLVSSACYASFKAYVRGLMDDYKLVVIKENGETSTQQFADQQRSLSGLQEEPSFQSSLLFRQERVFNLLLWI